MSQQQDIIPGLCFIIPLKPLRSTPKVDFHLVPEIIQGLNSIDRVHHAPGAESPCLKNSMTKKVWYMHPNQIDNLIVYQGKRIVELFSSTHGKVETFEVTPDSLKHDDKIIHEGPHVFGWPVNVFHRVHSPEGSLSSNFAKWSEGFDIKTNFNIYELDTETGASRVVRAGHLDQL